ncbi:MAG: hypothetical protein V8S92_03070 [Oscillospiraceae bacterium]
MSEQYLLSVQDLRARSTQDSGEVQAVNGVSLTSTPAKFSALSASPAPANPSPHTP